MSRHLDTLSCIPSQPVFALIPYCCVLNGEATNTNVIVLGLTRSGLEPTIYRTRGEHANHYTINAVQIIIDTRYNVCKVCLTCNLFENTKMCSFDNWTSSYCESVAKITPSLIWQKYYVGRYASTPNQEWPITDCWKNIFCGNTDRDPNQVWLFIVHVRTNLWIGFLNEFACTDSRSKLLHISPDRVTFLISVSWAIQKIN